MCTEDLALNNLICHKTHPNQILYIGINVLHLDCGGVG